MQIFFYMVQFFFNIVLLCSRTLSNHYDVLNLSRNCSAKEIKESFIKLSKENHPDINRNKDAHKKFLQINEAYKVLSKAESRRHYDLTLAPTEPFFRQNGIRVQYRETYANDPWKDPSFYMNRNRADDKKYEDSPYYGIKGIPRLSNLTIFIYCVMITIFVVGLQFYAIRNSSTFRREDLIQKSNAAEDSWRRIKENAAVNGNELQIELLRQKLDNNAKYRDK